MLYLRADFVVRVKQHSELWCNRRASERRAELARAIPSEEEEGEANRRQAESNVKLEYCRGAEEEDEVKTYKEICRGESKRP